MPPEESTRTMGAYFADLVRLKEHRAGVETQLRLARSLVRLREAALQKVDQDIQEVEDRIAELQAAASVVLVPHLGRVVNVGMGGGKGVVIRGAMQKRYVEGLNITSIRGSVTVCGETEDVVFTYTDDAAMAEAGWRAA